MINKGQMILPAHGNGVFSPVYIDNLVDGTVLVARRSSLGGSIAEHLQS